MAAQNEVPGFLPSRNGWPFPNNLSGTYPAVTLPMIGPIASANAGNGICGGFAFTARDLFEHQPRLAPDPSAAAPAQGSPTFEFLASRYLDSLGSPPEYANAAKTIAWVQLPDHDVLFIEGLVHQMAATEWPKVKSTIDSGHLCPLYVIRGPEVPPADIPAIVGMLGQCHQVLAYRYVIDGVNNVAIGIYDPNDPGDDTSVITFNASNPAGIAGLAAPGLIAHIEAPQYQVRGFFVADYAFRDPGGSGAAFVPAD